MSPDLFYEAFFFFSRREAEKLRLVCRNFDALCSVLRDVHGYKLQIDWMSIGRKGISESAKYSAIVEAYGGFHEIAGIEEELAAGLKATMSGSTVQRACIYTSALCESLCGESSAFFSGAVAGASVETVDLVGRYPSTYYNTVSSRKLQKFLLSFDAIGELHLSAKLVDGDLEDDFILRCRAKGIRALRLAGQAAYIATAPIYEFPLQETSEDELLKRFAAMKSTLVSASR